MTAERECFPEPLRLPLERLPSFVTESRIYHSDNTGSRSRLTTYEIMFVVIDILLSYDIRRELTGWTRAVNEAEGGYVA